MLMADLLVAIGFLCLAVIPLAVSFSQESKLLLRSYQRTIAMEIVDGETEVLAAGEWRSYSNGIYQLTSPARAATNLPPGRLQLTVTEQSLRVEWLPLEGNRGFTVRREIMRP